MSVLSRINPRQTSPDLWPFTRATDPFELFSNPNSLFRLYDDMLKVKPRNGDVLAFVPDVDLTETDSEVKLSAELPGLDEKEVSISLTPDTLTLSGEKKVESEEKKEGFYRLERARGSFLREIPLPVEVDVDKVDARLHNGVLSITLKKSAKARSMSKKIEIKSH